NHAEEAERLVSGRPKLMPGHGWDRDQVVGGDLPYLAGHQAVAVAAQDQNVVGVLMALEGGEARRRDLEIAQLAPLLGVGEQHLAGDRLEQSPGILLVGLHRDAVPAIVSRL